VLGLAVKYAVGALDGGVGVLTVAVMLLVVVPSVLSAAMIRRTTLYVVVTNGA